MKKETTYSVYIEMTPNPNSMKFVSNKWLITNDQSLDLSEDSAKNISPIAEKLFSFPFLSGVFIADNFITLTKKETIEWNDVQFELRDQINQWLNEGTNVVDESFYKQDNEPITPLKSDEIITNNEAVSYKKVADYSAIDKKIIGILDEYIKPAIKTDGGAIDFVNFEEGVVFLELKGSCNGCPSSTVTLKSGIEQLLKNMLPEDVKAVTAINI